MDSHIQIAPGSPAAGAAALGLRVTVAGVPLAHYLHTSQSAVPPARPWRLEDGAEDQGE